MNWLKEIWLNLTRGNDMKRRNKEACLSEDPVGWNVYVESKTKKKDFIKAFGKVHAVFKYRLIVPILIIAKKFFLPPYKHEGLVLKTRYNKEWLVFEKAYNLAMVDAAFYLQHQGTKDKGMSWEDTAKSVAEKRDNQTHLKTIKQSIIYLSSMDTFYHEFGVFFMHRLAQEMNKEFKGQPYHRIIYDTVAVNDFNWYLIQQMLDETNGTLKVNMEKIKPKEGFDENQQEEPKVERRKKRIRGKK
jgi:hypothetical protein